MNYRIYDPEGAAHGESHKRVTADEYEAAAREATEKAMAEKAHGKSNGRT